MPRTRDELLMQLRSQMDALRISSAAYDDGTTSEATRLAAIVYILVHDGKRRTTSLLTQIDALDKMRFMASAPSVDDHNLLFQTNLVIIAFGESATAYLPLLDQGPPIPPRWIPFADWWNERVMRDNNLGQTLTRNELVRTLADQEGGRHFDEELRNPAYIKISSQDFGWKWVTPSGERQINPAAHFATMRQIAWEIEKSIQAAAIS
jgi:hypothetical protein